MSKHYGNLEVAGKIVVGLETESDSYSFPLSTSGKSEGQVLVLVDSGGNLELDFDSLDSSYVSYTPTAPADWSSTPTSVSQALDTLAQNISGGSVSSGQFGVVDAQIGQNVYTITHLSTTNYPVASIVAPTSGSTLSVIGIFDKTNTEFKVLLSSTPASSGYKVSWYLP